MTYSLGYPRVETGACRKKNKEKKVNDIPNRIFLRLSIMFTSRNINIIGFQFEPERPNNKQQIPSYNDDEPDAPESPAASRTQIDVSEWCLCEKCERMPSAVECLCCNEVDTIKYLQLRYLYNLTSHFPTGCIINERLGTRFLLCFR